VTLSFKHRAATALAAAACGAAAGLAHPPFGLLPGLLGWAGLLWLLDRADGARPLKSAFWRGWWMGVGYFLVGTWWVAEAFLVDAASHGWMAPFAVMLLPAGMGLFWGLASLGYVRLGTRGPARVLTFTVLFSLIEWVRGWFLTGFPWNLPGETWAAGSAVSQNASVFGVFGLTFLTIAIVASVAALAGPGRWRTRLIAPLLGLAALAGMYGYGHFRLESASNRTTGLVVRIVQPDVDQKDKWRPENLPEIVEDYVRLSRSPGAEKVDVLFWPEGALPAIIDQLLAPGSPYADRIISSLSPGQTLFMGANRLGGTPEEPTYHNSVVVLRREADATRVAGVYDKHHLLPFGEYLPLGELMTRLGVRSLVHMPADYTPGPPPRPLTLTGLPPVQILICYESIFPNLIGKGPVRPEWIVVPSNDSWFGETSGPWQHLNVGTYRTLEQGLPMVRSTPTGISAVIDPYGRTATGHRLEPDAIGVIDAPLPAALPPTVYSRWGEIPFWALIVFGAAVALLFGHTGQKRRDSQALTNL
jgi:apolipoprotein N-acyltransferase